jgi:hypothetical protein
MAYEDMARSHVKELAREAFALERVREDADGDLPFPFGTAMVYVSVVGEGRVVRVWSRIVGGVRITKPVLQEVNDVNAGLIASRVWATACEVWIEACMPVEVVRPCDVGFLLAEVGRTADRLGSMLAAVHGGRVANPEAAEHEWED